MTDDGIEAVMAQARQTFAFLEQAKYAASIGASLTTESQMLLTGQFPSLRAAIIAYGDERATFERALADRLAAVSAFAHCRWTGPTCMWLAELGRPRECPCEPCAALTAWRAARRQAAP